ncbi:MAG: hypothetical protein HN809_12410 [Rhodospirillaceae bacterium]|nr:hypothetical protein [Rhodospirillaceae bacterium]
MTNETLKPVDRFSTLFQSYSKKHVEFIAKSSRAADGKSEGKYSVEDDLIDFAAHLSGALSSYAAIPLLDDGQSCKFGAIDIDEIGINLKALANDTRELPLSVCGSKSGGAHLYLFAEEPVPATLMQRILGEWAIALGYPNAEIFPKQVERSEAETGNAINLPYFGGTRCMVSTDGKVLSLEHFLDEAEKRAVNQAYLETVKVTVAENKITVSGSYAGRNNYLNALGFKMLMQGETIEDVSNRLHKVNEEANVDANANFSEGPLPKTELKAILKSLSRVQPRSNRLSKEYAIIQVKDKVRVCRYSFDPETNRFIWQLLSKSDFLLREKNSRDARDWLTNDARVYDGFTFDPCAGPVVHNHINLWKGWSVEPKPGVWAKLRSHIETVIAPGHGEYVINWLAWSFQNPSQPAEVAIVLRGGRGTGKGMFARAVLKAAGQHSVHVSSAEQITGRFNAHLHDCLFFFADEAFWAGDKSHEGQLKRVITEPTLFIEQKYQNPIQVKNMLKIMIATNEDWAVPAGIDERRFAVFDVSVAHQQDRNYFDVLQAETNNGGIAAMMHDLLNMDLGKFHPRQDVPKTAALNEQAQFSEDAVQTAIRRCLETGTLPGTYESYDNPNFVAFPNFARFVSEQAFGRNATSTKIGRALIAIKGVQKFPDFRMFVGKSNDGSIERKRVVGYSFPPLADTRHAFDPHADWDDSEDWQFDITVECDGGGANNDEIPF